MAFSRAAASGMDLILRAKAKNSARPIPMSRMPPAIVHLGSKPIENMAITAIDSTRQAAATVTKGMLQTVRFSVGGSRPSVRTRSRNDIARPAVGAKFRSSFSSLLTFSLWLSIDAWEFLSAPCSRERASRVSCIEPSSPDSSVRSASLSPPAFIDASAASARELSSPSSRKRMTSRHSLRLRILSCWLISCKSCSARFSLSFNFSARAVKLVSLF